MRKNYCLLCFALCIISACGTEKDPVKIECGEEKVTTFSTMSGTVFLQYFTDNVVGDVTYSTAYSNNGVSASFIFLTDIQRVCTAEDVLVSPTMVLNTADASVSDSLFIFSPAGNTIAQKIAPSAGTVYLVDEVYTFLTVNGATNLSLKNTITFPTLGSWSADSAKFFGNLSSYFFGTTYTQSK